MILVLIYFLYRIDICCDYKLQFFNLKGRIFKYQNPLKNMERLVYTQPLPFDCFFLFKSRIERRPKYKFNNSCTVVRVIIYLLSSFGISQTIYYLKASMISIILYLYFCSTGFLNGRQSEGRCFCSTDCIHLC